MRSRCPTGSGIVAPPSPIIALAFAGALSVSSPGDPGFVPLTGAIFSLDDDSVGFTHANGVLTLGGAVSRLVDVRGHATVTAPDAGTDVVLGVVLDGVEFLVQGSGLIILGEGDADQVVCDALVLMSPGQNLRLAIRTGAAVDLSLNLVSLVAKSP